MGWPVHVADIAAQGGTSCVGEGNVAGDGLGLGLGDGDGDGDGEGDGLLWTKAVGVDPHAETTMTAASASSPTLRLTGHSNEEAWWVVTDLRRQGTGAQGYGETGAAEPMSLRLHCRLTHRMSRRTAPERPFGYILDFGFIRAGRGMR